jgi:glucans biosynthesis protein
MSELRLTRRGFSRIGALVAAWSAIGARPSSAADSLGDAQPFSFERLIERTKQLAGQAYVAPPTVPDWLTAIPYDQWREITFRPEQAVWADSPSYRLQFFFPGSFYKNPVRVYVVDGGTAREVRFSPSMFDLGVLKKQQAFPDNLGFAGFSVHYPLEQPTIFQELLAFLGASYFRAIGRGTRYGLSARGLALNTGLGKPEEFPLFREFWVQRPSQPTDPLTIYALLDSPSVAGAFRFDIVAREHTRFDIDCNLFFRAAVDQVGLAPLTSMFSFGPNDRRGVEDYRNAVHNSDGLAMWTSSGDVLWRPVVNPSELRLSVIGDENPRGFGLLQRERQFAAYEDLEARYDLRPNLWVEPRGTWGKGSVRLIEIPTPDETHDNIVAFWTPDAKVDAASELRVAYGLIWSLGGPLDTGLAKVQDTRIGAPDGHVGPENGPRLIVIDFERPSGDRPRDTGTVEPSVSAGNSKVDQIVIMDDPLIDGWRVSFVVQPATDGAVELRCYLKVGDRRISEIWLYRLDKS